MRADGWSDAKLRELVVAGGLQTGPFGGQLHADEYVADGVPVVMPQDIISGEISTEHIARVSEEKAASLAQHRLRTGDLVFARRGDIGRVGMARDRENGWLCGTGCLRARPSERVSPVYLHYAVRRASSIAWLNIHAVGQTMLNLNTSILGQLPADVPPLPEQRAIAAVLDSLDDAIQKTEQIIAKLQQVKQGLLHDLLTRGIDDNGELRDPERHPEQFQDSPLGRIPKGWDCLPVSALLAEVDPPMRSGPFGSALLKEELVDRGVPLIGIDNVYVERFSGEFTRFVTSRKADELARYLVRPCDVMITIMGTVGRCCVVPEDIGRALSSKHVWTLSFDRGRYPPALACLQFNYSPWALRHFARDEQGGIMAAIRSDTLRSLLLPVPPYSEAQQITDMLADLTCRIEREAQSAAKHRLARAGLADDLLTGRVRTTSLPGFSA